MQQALLYRVAALRQWTSQPSECRVHALLPPTPKSAGYAALGSAVPGEVLEGFEGEAGWPADGVEPGAPTHALGVSVCQRATAAAATACLACPRCVTERCRLPERPRLFACLSPLSLQTPPTGPLWWPTSPLRCTCTVRSKSSRK